MNISEFRNVPGIYKISIHGTNKVYIGESIKVKSRLRKHISHLSKQCHSNPILQNLYNKYGGEAFDFEILEYVENADDQLLKKLEKDWQEKFITCISLDCNKYNQTPFRKSRKQIYQKNAISTIHNAIAACRKSIIIYDIVEDKLYEFDQVKDGYNLIERKHMNKCLKSVYKVAFKNRYVAYYKSEFKGVDWEKIIKNYDNTKKYITSNKRYHLYNMYDSQTLSFSSKQQLGKFLNLKHSGSAFYKKLITNNIIYWSYYSGIKFTKRTIRLAEIYLRNTSYGSKRVNLLHFYKCLKNYTSLIELEKVLQINRHTLSKIFKERSQVQWLIDIEHILSALPE